MNILIFSLGEKGLSVVKALAETGAYSITCVIGCDDGVEDDFSSALVELCNRLGIKYSMRSEAGYDAASQDYFLAVGWRWIIRDIPKDKLIVFHDSLLPRYRGFAPLVNALINKEPTTGVTALLATEEYDRGNILLQKSIDISYPTNIKHEIQRISICYASLAVELISRLRNRTINPHGETQDEGIASYSLWRDEEDYRIDWNDDASQIEHFVNCVGYPYRGASALNKVVTVRIIKARVRADVKFENRSPGKVVFIEDGFPVVVCGKGLLTLLEVVDERGESILPLKSFRSRFS